MKIIAGLGNPGLRYSATRHNCGFLTIDALGQILSVEASQKKHDSLIAQAMYKGEKLFLVKPQSFMNLSGYPLMQTVNFFKVNIEDILVIFDDMALEPGVIRFRRGGTSGGHNGIASVIEQTGTTQINRLKIGIGPNVFANSADYVTAPFTLEEMPLMAESFKKAAVAALEWAENGISAAMNKYNVKAEAQEEAGN